MITTRASLLVSISAAALIALTGCGELDNGEITAKNITAGWVDRTQICVKTDSPSGKCIEHAPSVTVKATRYCFVLKRNGQTNKCYEVTKEVFDTYNVGDRFKG